MKQATKLELIETGDTMRKWNNELLVHLKGGGYELDDKTLGILRKVGDSTALWERKRGLR